MPILIYFSLNAIESFLLAIYLFLVGSNPQEQIFLNLSPSRLAAVVFAAGTGVLFLLIGIRSQKNGSRIKKKFDCFLKMEGALWVTFIASLILASLIMFLITREINLYGKNKLVYQRLEPILAWGILLAVQTALFTATWYCMNFIENGGSGDNEDSKREFGLIFALFVVFALVKYVFISSTAYGPTGRGDEMTYFDMAESFYRGFFSIEQTHHYPPLYPLSLVPALVFKGSAYTGIKIINALLSSSIVFPIYLVLRQFMDARKSLLTTLVTCIIPYHLVFPRRMVSENLFFPLFMWALLATFSKPAKRDHRMLWNVMNGILVGALYLTRYITLALIPTFLLAWWIKPFDGEKGFFRPTKKKVFHFLLISFFVAATFSPWVLMAIADNLEVRLALGFGITSRTTREQLTLTKLLVWAFMYVCYYALTAAPVLNLLFSSQRRVFTKEWREGFSRLIFQTLIIMGGFFAAVVRHSWRAYYNRDLPGAIMGRYLIVFSAVFIMIASIEIKRFRKDKFNNIKGFILLAFLVPAILAVLSHMTIIQTSVIPTRGNLLKAHGSADGFMIEQLGLWYFVLVTIIYASVNLLLWTERKNLARAVFTAGLTIYFISGWPAYYDTLLESQTFPWIGTKIAALAPQVDIKSGEFEKVTVYVPPETPSDNRAEIYNALRVRGVDNTTIEYATTENIQNMETTRGFIIEQIEKAPDVLEKNEYLYEYQDKYYLITEINV